MSKDPIGMLGIPAPQVTDPRYSYRSLQVGLHNIDPIGMLDSLFKYEEKKMTENTDIQDSTFDMCITMISLFLQ